MQNWVASLDVPVSVCSHLKADPNVDYFRYFTGNGVASWLLCSDCLQKKDEPLSLSPATKNDAILLAQEGFWEGTAGSPEIVFRPNAAKPLAPIREIIIPGAPVIAMAPLPDGAWLACDSNGTLSLFDPDHGIKRKLACISFSQEKDLFWFGHHLAPRLIVDRLGRFAALIHDYGRFGVVVDLNEGKETMRLDGGGYHPETVPFSACFSCHHGRTILVHRTDWNRLDASDPVDGTLLSKRELEPYAEGDKRPLHYLDYFHGELLPNPSGTQILNDGWIWAPMGIPYLFRVDQWIGKNVWETEDMAQSCQMPAREDWAIGACWIDDDRFVLGHRKSQKGKENGSALVFQVSSLSYFPLAGPEGAFFSDGERLFSADQNGLSLWSVDKGLMLGRIPDFHPTLQHTKRRELIEIKDGSRIICWSY